MIVLHMEDMKLDEDYTYWRPMGMKASVSCRFDFTGIVVNNSQLLGQAEDYEREPDFSGGAARFAAVQLGGAEAAIQVALNHLLKFDRTNDPNQLRRIGELAILQKRGRIWLEKAGSYADNKKIKPDAFIQYANMFRTEARTICEEILRLTELSVGLQGLMAPHPLERIHRDLSVYLKQPGPDRILEECGRFYIKKISDFDSTPS
jgi:alkylation response protein AidB-like acyl-CoA dehydrogenase